MTGAATGAGARALSLAFVLPYGEVDDGFFPDTLLALLGADARAAGHQAAVVRVYYDGHDPDRDREVARRLTGWLAAREADLVVVDRLFDVAPLRQHVSERAGRACVLVSRGDSFDPIDGVDWAVGLNTGRGPGGRTRRAPTLAELRGAFGRLVDYAARRFDGPLPAGVTRFAADGMTFAPAEPPADSRLGPFQPIVDQDVICLEPPPKVVRKTLFGNTGCPFAADPLENPHYAGVTLDGSDSLSRLGCAFCSMGGDYQKRPDRLVVDELVEQALFHTRHHPELEELVLNDQHALRYLALLVTRASEAGVRPVRWLFAARADSFVRERERVEAAIGAARQRGHLVEVYLTGFEAFSDRELLRYNKGATVAELLAAIATMRELAVAHPGAFAYNRARGHSLILWNPWTRPADLRETVEVVRAHGLGELFDELALNRLRLYADLPVTFAARRDRLVTLGWEDGDEGAGRRKGYNVEHPWRFEEPATRLAFALAQRLRGTLGAETEIAQLRAVTDLAAAAPVEDADPAPRLAATLAPLGRLDAVLEGLLLPERAAGQPSRGRSIRAAVASFAGGCNNGCVACAQRDGWLDDRPEAVLARVERARALGLPVVLAGREPTLHPAFLELCAAAAGPDRRPVGVVTNGRRFAVPAFARAAIRQGLAAASVKLFAPDAAEADAIARAPGSHAQALAGVRALVAGRVAVELRLPLERRNLARLEAFVPLARALGVGQLRVEVALDAVGLDRLEEAATALERLAAGAATEGLALEASPLRAGSRAFSWMPGSLQPAGRG